MIDDKSLILLNEIIEKKEVNIFALMDRFELTNRQFNYSVDKINEYFDFEKEEEIKIYDDELVLTELSLRIIQKQIGEYPKHNKIYYTKPNRQKTIFIYIASMNEYISLNHLIENYEVSKSTLLKDIKEVNERLFADNIEIMYSRKNGYYLRGNEMSIRLKVIKEINELLIDGTKKHLVLDFIHHQLNFDIDQVLQKVEKLADYTNVHFFGNKLDEFIYSYLILRGRFVRPFNAFNKKNRLVKIDYSSKEYIFAKSLFEKSSYSNLHLSNVDYVYYWLLGLLTGDINDGTKDRPWLLKLVNEIILRLETISGIKFNNFEDIQRQIYEHFRPAYYRILFNLPIINPFTLEIKEEYEELYNLITYSLKPVEDIINQAIPEDEVAFLCMHFHTFINERSIAKRKYKAVIICPNGIGTSMLLKNGLEDLFDDIEFKISRDGIVEKADIIFSPVLSDNLKRYKIPYLVVNPIMNTREKLSTMQKVFEILDNNHHLFSEEIESVLEVVKAHVDQKQFKSISENLLLEREIIQCKENEEEYRPMLSEITSEELIKLNIKARDWKEAIREGTKSLVEFGKVSENYIDQIIKTAEETGPYFVITDHVALPHARPADGALEIAISIATLEDAIEFGHDQNDPVKYIFGLSALDNKSHLTAMSELAELLEDESFYEILEHAKSSKEILNYIKNFEEKQLKE